MGKAKNTQNYVKGIDPGFNLYTFPPVDVSVEDERSVDFFPIAPLKSDQCIEFQIPNTGFLYSDLSRGLL